MGDTNASIDPSSFGPLVERLDHVAVAVWDLGDAAPLAELMGGTFRTGGIQRRDAFRWAQWDLPGGKLEILQPLDALDDDSFLVRFLRGRGPGLHHVTLKVTDIAAAVARARELGFEVTGLSTEFEGWKEAFVHPSSAHGVLIQLAEFDEIPVPRRTLDDVLSMA